MICAIVLDLAFGEPPNRWHPVAWLGHAIACLQRAAPAGGRVLKLAYGLMMVQAVVCGAALLGTGVTRLLATCPPPLRLFLLGAMLKLTFSFRDLAETAERIGSHLQHGRLDEARSGLRALVSRRTDELDAEHSASAAIESLAENLSDSLLAPILYYSLFGLPAAMAYRASNTLDAMIGYHGAYEDLGKAAARLDDLFNLLPARMSALFLVAAAFIGRGDGRAALRTLAKNHARTESPNAGWPMSATAGALHVRLEKMGHYRLGDRFPAPTPTDIHRAVRLYYAAAALGIISLFLWETVGPSIPSPVGRGSG